MEKVNKYRQIVEETLKEIHGWEQYPNSKIEKYIVIDKEQGHFLYFTDGWNNDSRFYTLAIHISVTNRGSVWLQHDGTEYVVGQLLVDKGIPKSDIVVGWHSPYERKLTEFAEA